MKLKRKNSFSSTSYRAEANCINSSLPPTSRKDEKIRQAFAPFISGAFVTLPDEQSTHVPIKVLRDTAASQSFVLESVLTFCDKSYSRENVLVQGFEMGFASVPLHEVSLTSELVTGEFKMGVRPSLPVQNVHVLLGDDIMGGVVFPKPVVTNSPQSGPDDLSVNFPEVFHANVVTRAMAQKANENVGKCGDQLVDLFDTFIARPLSGNDEEKTKKYVPLSMLPCIPKTSCSREQLILQQKNVSLSSLLVDAMSEKGIESMPQGCFFRDGVLMRKWRPLTASVKDDWRVLNQIVVPALYRNDVLRLAHHFSGHLGINKTSDRNLRHFFWPGLKRDVANYCKTCPICQVTETWTTDRAIGQKVSLSSTPSAESAGVLPVHSLTHSIEMY